MSKKALIILSGIIISLSSAAQTETSAYGDNRAMGTFTENRQRIIPIAGDVAIG